MTQLDILSGLQLLINRNKIGFHIITAGKDVVR